MSSPMSATYFARLHNDELSEWCMLRGNILCLNYLGIILFFLLPSVYLLYKQTIRFHTIYIKCNDLHDMIWFFIFGWSPSSNRHDLYPAVGAKSGTPSWRKPAVSPTYHNNHITSYAPLQNKVRRSSFYPFANFTWLLGLLEISTASYLRTYNHNIGFITSFYYPLKEAFACTAIPTKVGETTPAKPHYSV